MPNIPYKFGGKITKREFDAVLLRFYPDPKKPPSKMPPKDMLKNIYAYFPDRLEHEVNRIRGFAFDSGEAGFSHVRIP